MIQHYTLSTNRLHPPTHGLCYTSDSSESLHTFVNFLKSSDESPGTQAYYDVYWTVLTTRIQLRVFARQRSTVSMKQWNNEINSWISSPLLQQGTITKKMCWIDLHKTFVRGNVHQVTISVSHIPGKSNLSECFATEFRDVNQLIFLLDPIKYQ